MFADTENIATSYVNTPGLTYQYHETLDIHEIHLSSATQHTMKDFFQLITRFYYAAPTNGTTRILIRQTGPALPLNHFMGEMRTFISQHRKMPRSAPARFAIVLELSPFLQLLRQILKLMRHQDAVMFFDEDDSEKAQAWLHES